MNIMDLAGKLKFYARYTKEIDGVIKHVTMGMSATNIPTKWVTETKWDYKLEIRLNLEMTNVFYVDGNGRLLFTYDENDKEWELY